MITQNLDLLMDFDFYTDNIEEIKEKQDEFLGNLNKKLPENVDYIEKDNISIEIKTEKAYSKEYKAKFKIKIPCKANFTNYARFCIELDSTLEEIIDAFRIYGEYDIDEKIILKETLFLNKTYYG